MKKLNLIVVTIILFSCKNQNTSIIGANDQLLPIEFNQEVADELARRAVIDQTAAWIRQGKFKDYSKEKWKAYKDSVFTSNKIYLEEILNKYGYPGIDLVGKDGAHDFWLMTQHCDFDPNFQARVLDKMKVEVDNNNVNKSNYAYLVDRVRVNKGQKILYGTQVRYNSETGQAMSKPLADSLNINKRRKEVGLDPLEVYLNDMSISHFEMNKQLMLKRGIMEPKLYKVENGETVDQK